MLNRVKSVLKSLRDDAAATTAEYGIVIVVMAAIAFGVVASLNGSLNGLYGTASSKTEAAATYSATP